MARSWLLFGQKRKNPSTGEEYYRHVYAHTAALRMSGVPDDQILSLNFIEDENGTYLGFVRSGEEKLTMVQLEHIFQVQFPYGAEASQASGEGEVVRLRAEPVR